jgi:hypothetical protein
VKRSHRTDIASRQRWLNRLADVVQAANISSAGQRVHRLFSTSERSFPPTAYHQVPRQGDLRPLASALWPAPRYGGFAAVNAPKVMKSPES